MTRDSFSVEIVVLPDRKTELLKTLKAQGNLVILVITKKFPS